MEFIIFIDPSNEFNKIFIPFARKFVKVLQEQNHIVFDGGATAAQPNARKIIFGAHSNPKRWLAESSDQDIIVNLEPVYKREWRSNNELYLRLLENRYVLDYCNNNTEYLNVYSLVTIPSFENPLIEDGTQSGISFVGSINEYRRNCLIDISNKIIPVDAKFKIFGSEMFDVVQNAKIFLNLDLDSESIFNLYRFSYCAASTTLFAGHAGDISSYPEVLPLVGITLFYDHASLLSGLKRLIEDSEYYEKALSIQHEVADCFDANFSLRIGQIFNSDSTGV